MSTNMEQNFDNLFEALGIIVDSKLKNVKYDKTIVATILDDSNAEKQQKYRCSDGSYEFDAYSDKTDYKKGDSVQVSIPNGDYDQQKYIVGKYMPKESAEAYSYRRPMEMFVDVTGNLATSEVRQELISNAKSASGNLIPTSEELWSWPPENNTLNVQYIGYSQIAVKGNFTTLLDPTVSAGHYGYILIIEGFPEDVETRNDASKIRVAYTLDSMSDMYGNPYGFTFGTSQEAVFNLGEIYEITGMKLEFYQQSDFVDKFGRPTDTRINPDLFTSDWQVYLGYSVNEFGDEDDVVKIYTTNTSTYDYTKNDNEKVIRARWLHKDANGNVSVVNETNPIYEEATINWYRYRYGAPSADDYCGVYWDLIGSVENGELTHILYDDKWNTVTANGNKIGTISDDGFSLTFSPNASTRMSEQIKVIIIYETEVAVDSTISTGSGNSTTTKNTEVIRSNILEFTSIKSLMDQATAQMLAGLSLRCSDENQGNYFVYGQDNSILQKEYSNQVRSLTPYFGLQSSVQGDGLSVAELTEATKIIWEFPTKNSMIVYNSVSDSNVTKVENNTGYTTITINNPQSTISHKFNYTIKPNYNASDINNTVSCTIIKDNITYYAHFNFTFGLMGTNGTDAKLVINFVDKAEQALPLNNSGTINVQALLYDYSHNLIDFTHNDYKNLKISWNIEYQIPANVLNEDNRYFALSPNKTNNSQGSQCLDQCAIEKKYTTNNSLPFLIISVTIEGFGNYPLIAYLPIPFRKDEKYKYIQGPTSVVYNSAGGGTADYEKTKYLLKYSDSSRSEWIDETNVNWQVYDPYPITIEGSPATRTTIGFVSLKNILQPATMYFDGENPYGVYCYSGSADSKDIYWVQPLVIMQNLYPSPMLNKWDGKEVLINNDEGYILSPVIAAGKKENNNSFSGVMIGAWGKKAADNSVQKDATGVYGFNNGQLTYAFKEDGTAFIGKSNRGRIEFDGNSGVIKSSAWRTNHQFGMHLDIDEGEMLLQQPEGYVIIQGLTENQFNSNKSNYYYRQIQHQQVLFNNANYNKSLDYYTQRYVEILPQLTKTMFDSYKQNDLDDENAIFIYNNDEEEFEKINAESSYNVNTPYYKINYVLENILMNDENTAPADDDWNTDKDAVLSQWNIYRASEENAPLYFTVNPNAEKYIRCTNSSQFSQTETYYQKINMSKYITLSAAQSEYPLAIGVSKSISDRHFKVDWNGIAYIKDGVFEGEVSASTLTAYDGSIGGWSIDSNTLSGGDLILDSSDGSITGGILKSTNHQIKLIGNLLTIPVDKWNNNQRANGLYLGAFEGSYYETQQQDGEDVEVITKTDVVGLQNNLSDRSLVIENTPVNDYTNIRIGNQNQMNNLILSSGKMSIHVNSKLGSQSEHLVIKDQNNNKIYLQFLNKNYINQDYSLFYIPDDAHVAIGSMNQNGWNATDTSANLTTKIFNAITSITTPLINATTSITTPLINATTLNISSTINIPAPIYDEEGDLTNTPIVISPNKIDFSAVGASSQIGIYARFA